ncbi:MAG: sigma-70 family RNA polymerase sigma factor [Bacteroidetes bacterium]|nr:sigma-70 family RNA polymerase sigma factor [Bacteroidota bacterium]
MEIALGSRDIGVRARSFVSCEQSEQSTNYKMEAAPSTARTVELSIDEIRRLNDEELVKLFQQGKEIAFRFLVERHQSRIRNLLYSIFHEREFADDLAQEVFIKAYRALHRFRFESSFYTWLYRIAINRSRDEMRHRKLQRFFSFEQLDEGVEAELQARIATHPKNRDDEELVALGLKMVPEPFKSAVILRDIEGLTYEEIADVLKCELGTVKSRIARGRAMLRKVLKPLLEEPRQ